MFISDAYADEGVTKIVSSLFNLGGLWLPVLIIFTFLFLFLIRPKQKEVNKRMEKIKLAQRGDKIVTTSGIYGKIVKMPTKDTMIVEIAPGVEIKMKKNKIAEVL